MTVDEAREIAIATLNEVNAAFEIAENADRLQKLGGAFELKDAELDSLGVVDWAMRIETETGVDIEPVIFQRFAVLDDVAMYLAEKAK